MQPVCAEQTSADTPNDENYIMWTVHGQPKYTLAFI